MNKMILTAMTIGLALSSCASSPDDPNKHTKKNAGIGAAMGAIAGAVIGYQNDHSGGALRGALIGAAAGGALGAGTGVYMDKQEAEFKRELAEEQRRNQIEIERLQNESLKITMNSEVSFDYNSAKLTPSFHRSLSKVADILMRYPRSSIKVIGHTDSKGSHQYNQQLSEQRAQAVKWYLMDRGLASNRISIEGLGETQSRASNDSEAGRQLNRRVEMLVIPNNDIQ